MTRAKSGGGETMNKVVSTRNVKQEPVNHHISPTRPSQIGMAVYYHKSDLYQSTTTPQGPTNLMTVGVGAGRQILPSGSQSRTPKVSSPPKSKLHW
jgi:hypothetical protein